MDRKKESVIVENDEVKEEVAISPLPGQEVIAQEVKEEVKADPASKTWYAFCRITAGLAVDIKTDDGETKIIRLKSGNTSQLAADGTRTFQAHPEAFGVTELSEQDAFACLNRLAPMKCYKKGFVFIVDDYAKGLKLAQQNVSNFPKQGTEQLTEADIPNNVQHFEENN